MREVLIGRLFAWRKFLNRLLSVSGGYRTRRRVRGAEREPQGCLISGGARDGTKRQRVRVASHALSSRTLLIRSAIRGDVPSPLLSKRGVGPIGRIPVGAQLFLL